MQHVKIEFSLTSIDGDSLSEFYSVTITFLFDVANSFLYSLECFAARLVVIYSCTSRLIEIDFIEVNNRIMNKICFHSLHSYKSPGQTSSTKSDFGIVGQFITWMTNFIDINSFILK